MTARALPVWTEAVLIVATNSILYALFFTLLSQRRFILAALLLVIFAVPSILGLMTLSTFMALSTLMHN